MEPTTPMLKQYEQIKSQHRDCILFFRLGDFYEMFYDDAKKASSILDVVLTSRDSGKSGRVPMCGIPYHAADIYIYKLIKAGQKVAICEQVEDPALAKGLVKRGVTRVITSGTFIDENSVEPRYLACVAPSKKETGIAFADQVSGSISANQYPDAAKAMEAIAGLPVHECIFPAASEETIRPLFGHPVLRARGVALSPVEDWCFNADIARKGLLEHFHTKTLKGFGIDELPLAVSSAGALLEYMKRMNKQPLRHIDRISLYSDGDYVFVSPEACRGLEIEELVKTIDRTLTPLGKRLFRNWVYHPLKNVEAIRGRRDAARILKESPGVRAEIEKSLKNMPDIEKALSRISCGYAAARDMLALRTGFSRVPDIQKALSPITAENGLLKVEDIPEVRSLLENAINPDVSLSNPEGKTIRAGYNSELDSLRDIQENGRQWLRNLQESEMKRTGIGSLKAGYNTIFGYYIEVSKTNLPFVPADYIRKQTLVNGERFITPELKEFEEKMLTAEEKILKIEAGLLREIQAKLLDRSADLHAVSTQIAVVDCLLGLSALAAQPGYIPPEITGDAEISIQEGRHPVVELYSSDPFVPNDTYLDCKENHLLIITGPNMAGKSTYIRQTAVLVIMAQMGSFIPAKSARIGIVDKIFTRIGARDDISKGHSTFMVEMSETAGILNNLSERSLIILD